MNYRYVYRGKHVHAMSKNAHLNGRWIEGYLASEDYIHLPELEGEFLIAPDTICQCTAEKDKHQNLIYENDIVRETCCDCIGVIKFGESEKGYGWYIQWISPKAKYFRSDFLYWIRKGNLSVYGNTIDNPELVM